MSHVHQGRQVHPAEPDQAAPLAPHRARGHPRPASRVVRRGLLRQVAGAAVHALRVPHGGLLRDQAVLPLRRLVHGHHERHQQVGAHVPEPQAGVRGQPGHLVQQRDPHGRRHPAGLHQLRARRHRRVGGRQRLHRRTRSSGCNYRVIVREQKCIEPLWESKSDYEIFAAHRREDGPARRVHRRRQDRGRLGQGLLRHLRPAQGRSAGRSSTAKGYHIININDDYKPTPGLRWFYEGRPCDTPDLGNPKRLTEKRAELGTFSGKIEFVSESLKQYFPDDEERPVVPRYIPSWEGHHTTELFEKYPLQLISPHPRFSFHCHYDKHTDWLNDIPVHRIKKDGYAWWPARINPEDAADAGHQQRRHRPALQRPGLGALHRGGHRARAARASSTATPRRPCTIRCSPGNADSMDRGGCVSMLTPVAHDVQERPGHDAQFLPHRDREVGGLRHGAPGPAHRRHQVQRLPQLLPGLPRRVLRQRLPRLLGSPAAGRPVLDAGQGDRAGQLSQAQARLHPASPCHALRGRALHRRWPPTAPSTGARTAS